MKKTVLFIIFLVSAQCSVAQSVGVGQWEDFLSYKNGLSVAEGDGKVYCATRSGIFSLNKSDNSIERLSKINGLADVEATVLGYNYFSHKLIIAYKNSNIDIIDNGLITNVSDIKRKTILGNKAINNVYFIDQYAYLACGFGIVVLDMNKIEVSDTYYIGPNGGSINVRDITSDDSYFYAATDVGVYKAARNNPNLANYSAWSLMTGLPSGIYNTITEFNGKIYTNLSKFLASGIEGQDTAYVYDNTTWNYFLSPSGHTIKSIKKQKDENRLLLIKATSVTHYDSSFTIIDYLDGYLDDYTRAEQAVVDNTNIIWVADANHGLVVFRPTISLTSYIPDGPRSSNVIAMDAKKNNLAVASGGGSNGYFAGGIYSYNGTSWTNVRGNYPPIANIDTVFNVNNVLIDPNDGKRIYAATGLAGIIEFYDGAPVTLYNQTNSSLQQLTTQGYTPIWTSGLAFDAASNLWVGNSGVPLSVSVKKADGTWLALDFSFLIGENPDIGQILVDRNEQKWIVLARGKGLMVYNGGTSAPNSTNAKKLTTAAESGALPSTNVFCLAEDLDGEIWVGTDKGITVFYTPESVFSGDNYDAQQILIEQDGHVQILFETELIQAIAVDGANRKWVATQNSGVFLMSPDGTTQIFHFDVSNSPLFSNDVKSIAINQETGVVYFGTTKGIISYRGTATGGGEFFTDVYSFPNPVNHTYDGPIAIKGLVNNTILKITDVSGSLVYETVSEGGQAIWNGKNFNGERVSTGVYMVFCASEDGTQKMVTKILFIN